MTIEIHGYCDARFQPLKDAFRAGFNEGSEVGASMALMLEGRAVLDVWAGHRDWARTKPWEQDTIVQVFSAAKIATVFSLLMLIDRQQVDLDATVATYWPEFAAGGKDRVTVRQAMTHRAGVPGFDPPVSFESLHDWDATCANIAAQTHWFRGEDAVNYHAMTYGFLIGEIIRRVDGRGLERFFSEEIAGKAGIDILLAIRSSSDRERLAEFGALQPLVWAPVDPVTERVNASVAEGDWTTEERLTAVIPACGYANGRSLARVAAIGAMHGELGGTRYLSAGILEESCRVQARSDLLTYAPGALGLGFGLDAEGFRAPTPTSAHWGGFGGSQWLMDPATGVSFGYAMNNLIMNPERLGGERWQRQWDALGEVMCGL